MARLGYLADTSVFAHLIDTDSRCESRLSRMHSSVKPLTSRTPPSPPSSSTPSPGGPARSSRTDHALQEAQAEPEGVNSGPHRVELLNSEHDLGTFSSGNDDLDTWLQRHGLAAQRVDSARTFDVPEHPRRLYRRMKDIRASLDDVS